MSDSDSICWDVNEKCWQGMYKDRGPCPTHNSCSKVAWSQPRSSSPISGRNLQMSPRKRPCCTKCGALMAGHARENGYLVCTIIPSPPYSSSPPIVELPSHRSPSLHTPPPPPPPPARDFSFEIPSTGAYRRRNPNWVPTRRQHSPDDDLGSSIVPTEIIEEDRYSIIKADQDSEPSYSLYGDDEEEEGETEEEDEDDQPGSAASTLSRASSGTFFENILSNSIPLASLFSTPRQDVERVRTAAKQRGLSVGLVHKPGSPSRRNSPSKASGSGFGTRVGTGISAEASSCWMVMGTHEGAVNHLIDLQHQAQAKAQAQAQMMLETQEIAIKMKVMEVKGGLYTPQTMNIMLLVFTGAIGGLMVVAFLAFL